MMALALILSLAAFTLLAAASDPHGARLPGGRVTPQRRSAMRRTAWAALTLALPAAIASDGWVFGPILWLALVMLAAGAVFVTLNLIAPLRVRR